MGADQYLLPHLGAQARVLLDHVVASGTAGVDGRDTDDWVLSRLIQLRYVEESSVGDTTFVCTSAGRHRWQIEIVAEEERSAVALRRLLIRRRLDERFIKLGIDTSTALMTAYPPEEPRLHRRVPVPWNPPPQTRRRISAPLAAAFAATAAALVVISSSTDPAGMRDGLLGPKPHAAAVLADQLKASAGHTVLVGSPAAAPVAAPVDPRAKVSSGHTVDVADTAPATERAAPADIVAPGQKKEYDNGAYQAEQDASVPKKTLTQVEPAVRVGSPVVDAASPDGGNILNSAVIAAALIDAAARGSGNIATDLTTSTESGFRMAAAALIDAAMSESDQIATDVAAGVERRFRQIAATLLHAPADMARTVSDWAAATQPVRDDAPALLMPAMEPPSEREQLAAASQPEFASQAETESVWAATDPASSNERAATAALPARRAEAIVDPQHAAVERLNTLSLAAARRGDAWRPTGRSM